VNQSDAADTAAEPEAFSGGQMVFFPDRVELCGVDICSGSRSERKRKALDHLRLQVAGQFVAYSGRKLAKAMDLADADRAAGAIRDLRKSIKEALLVHAGIECSNDDVILSGGSGYRLSEKLSVQDGGATHDHRHESKTGGGNVGDVGNPDVGDDGDLPEGPVERRRQWILHQLSAGNELKAEDVSGRFKCSPRTAERDLGALKKARKIEFVGTTRNGGYRLRPPVESED